MTLKLGFLVLSNGVLRQAFAARPFMTMNMIWRRTGNSRDGLS